MSPRATTARLAGLVIVVALATGCGGDADPGASAEDGDASGTEAIGVEVSTDFPRTVEHALGSTEVDEAPRRVVALDLSVVDSTLALGLDLIGYTTFSDPDGPLPAHFGAAAEDHAADAEWVGDLMTPNLEQIAALRPDLIVTAAVRHEAIYDELAAIAPTVATDSAGGGWKESLQLVAEATGRSDRAEELIGAYETRARAVGADVNAAAGDPTVSVVRFADAIRLYQPTSFSGTVLADAGLARPESQRDPDDFITIISEEQLAEADADVLLYTVYDNEDVQDFVDELLRRPLWASLGAVERGDAHPVPDETWMSGVGIFGAHVILDDLAELFGTDPHPVSREERP